MATDYISREALTDTLDSLCDRVCDYSKKQRWVMCGSCPLGSAFDVVEELSAADVVERKRGKWERKLVPVCDDGIIMIPGNVCSECGGITTYNVSLFKYCPRCGAQMESADDVLRTD